MKGMVPGGSAETNALKTVWDNLPPVQLADSVKQILPLVDTYEKARAKGAPISDAINAVNEAAKQHTSNIVQIAPVVDAFKANGRYPQKLAMGIERRDAPATAVKTGCSRCSLEEKLRPSVGTSRGCCCNCSGGCCASCRVRRFDDPADESIQS